MRCPQRSSSCPLEAHTIPVGAPPPITYTWDNHGNLTDRGADEFTWDYEDRMVSATVNSVTTTFAYRGDGLRDSRAVSGGATTTFTWDIASGLPVVLDDGNQYVYGAGLASMKQSGNWYYYLADGLGSTMAVVDSSGSSQKSYQYDVYGEVTGGTGSLANEFDFAGQQTDGTGLQYLRARYYDPETGTFLSREPMAMRPSWRSSTDAYGAGNPIRFSDPTGLWPGEGIVKKALESVLDVAAIPPYAQYYGAYEALVFLDGLTQLAGPAEPLVDVNLLPVTLPLVTLEGTGLAGDIAIDLLKDELGVGQGWADEGYVGSICPDVIADRLQCPEVYLHGVHPEVTVDEKGRKVADTSRASHIDFNWGF